MYVVKTGKRVSPPASLRTVDVFCDRDRVSVSLENFGIM